MTRSEQATLRLIDQLYSCVDGESSWPELLGAVAQQFDASLVGMTTNSSLQAVIGVDPSELIKYQQCYMSINPWLNDPSAYPRGKILLTEEVLPASTYRKTRFYNEWGKRNHVAHAVGGAIQVNQSSFLFLSINRGDAQGPYGEEERSIAQVLMPHFQRAANLHDRLHLLEQRAWVLDALAFPMLYADSAGTVRWANQAAESLLRKGQTLLVRGGRLHAQRASEDSALQKMLGARRTLNVHSTDGCGGWLRVTSQDDGTEISLFLTRAPKQIQRLIGIHDRNAGFLIFVASQAIDGNTLMSRVRMTWGLTTAEAALAVELLESEGLQEAATRLRITRNTAKTQLSSIFQKSGARRQSELARKLLALAVIARTPGL